MINGATNDRTIRRQAAADAPRPMSRLSNICAEVKSGIEGGPGRILLSWTDASGTDRREGYYGRSAAIFAADLHAATLIGEEARQVYLIGRIREVERLPG